MTDELRGEKEKKKKEEQEERNWHLVFNGRGKIGDGFFFFPPFPEKEKKMGG